MKCLVKIGFLVDHKDDIKLKNAGNIKTSRAAASEDMVKVYFDNSSKSIEGVSFNAIIKMMKQI